MSLEDLQTDLDDNIAAMAKLAQQGPLTTPADITAHLERTLWPFFKNVVAELSEMDSSIADLYQDAEDILQPETGAQLAAVLVTATGLITKQLVPRLDKDKDRAVLVAIKQWLGLAKEAGDTIEQITIPEEAEAAEGPDDEEDDEEDDGDEDEDDEDEDGQPEENK